MTLGASFKPSATPVALLGILTKPSPELLVTLFTLISDIVYQLCRDEGIAYLIMTTPDPPRPVV